MVELPSGELELATIPEQVKLRNWHRQKFASEELAEIVDDLAEEEEEDYEEDRSFELDGLSHTPLQVEE